MVVEQPFALLTGPLPSVSLDFARLQAEAGQLLERLATRQWTDFNTHDPGVTILEQLCYALTDLAYRIHHPMQDLLARGREGDLPGPLKILTSDPVTSDDKRRLALALDGVANVWVDAAESPLQVYYQARPRRQLRFEPVTPDASPEPLSGLHRILVQVESDRPGEPVLQELKRRFDAHRLLGEDAELSLVNVQTIGLRIEVEVGPVDAPHAVVADIIDRIERYLAPPATFRPLADAQKDQSLDELLEGPALPPEQGFLKALPPRRGAIYESDLVREIMDVPSVRVVRKIEMAASPTSPPTRWALAISPGSIAAPPDLTAPPDAAGRGIAGIQLLREGAPMTPGQEEVRLDLERRRRARRAPSGDTRGLEPPRGRDRSLGVYTSILRQFPACYGLPPAGLSPSTSAERRARALQLEAYLYFFDQLLANAFAQLDHVHALFAPNIDGDRVRTYFAQPVEDPPVTEGRPSVVRASPEAHRAWLEEFIEPGDPLERRMRLLAHLLARFSEDLGYEKEPGGGGASRSRRLVAQRETFLARYPEISRGRGSGIDLSGDWERPSLFEERLRLKLGLPTTQRFLVIENILLRPLAEDAGQENPEGEEVIPFLSDVSGPDPWSAQLTFVFEATTHAGREQIEFEQRVGSVILSETPAHLTSRLYWFDREDFEALLEAWREHRIRNQIYRQTRSSRSALPKETQLRARDARDRVLDLLEADGSSAIGKSYPLRDLPLPAELTVASGASATINLAFSQRGVNYQLFTQGSLNPIAAAFAGTGARLALLTPPITRDETFRIRAWKTDDESRGVWLCQTVRVLEGIDRAVTGELFGVGADHRLPSLSDNPSDQARIASYGEALEVRVTESQPGIAYVVVDANRPDVELSAPVLGTSEGILLPLRVPATEDLELRLLGRRRRSDPAAPPEEALLDQVLHLRVRPDPLAPARLLSPIIEHGASATVQIEARPNTSYRLYGRALRSRQDYAYGPSPEVSLLEVQDGSRAIWIVRPPRRHLWSDVEGFVPLGHEVSAGAGSVDLSLSSVDRDMALLVRANRMHDTAIVGSNRRVSSSVQLREALAVLVRPDRQVALRLEAKLEGDESTEPWRVIGGELGVFYRLAAGDTSFSQEAYFHEPSEEAAGRNKGVEEVRVERDLVIPTGGAVNTATDRPPAPLVEAPAPISTGTVLTVTARRALTNLEVPLDKNATLHAVPALGPEPATVSVGEAAAILIAASTRQDRYTLFRGNTQLGEPVQGTGGDLRLSTGALTESTVFEVAIERVSNELSLVRRVSVRVRVE